MLEDSIKLKTLFESSLPKNIKISCHSTFNKIKQDVVDMDIKPRYHITTEYVPSWMDVDIIGSNVTKNCYNLLRELGLDEFYVNYKQGDHHNQGKPGNGYLSYCIYINVSN